MVPLVMFSILCGAGLGGSIAVILYLSGVATPERNKWAVVGSTSLTTVLALVVVLYVTLSPTSEERIQEEFDLLSPYEQGTFLYEHTSTSSSATGECASVMNEHWYGLKTDINDERLVEWHSNQLINNGWHQKDEFWTKEVKSGHFTFHLDFYPYAQNIESIDGHPFVPKEVLNQLSNFPTVYLLSMGFMTSSSKERCFGS